MGVFTERLNIILDVTTDKASSALSKFKTSVGEAQGASGKFKAGLASVKESAGGFLNSAAGMTSAVTAVGGVMIQSAMSAEKLGLEVGQLAAATGLSTQAASRWIEVAGDLGLTTDQISGLITKMTVNLGKTPGKFAELGIATQHAKDGTVDMNATLLNAIDKLNAIQDPTKRAAAEQALFGKSFKDAAELVSMGSKKVEDRLKAVSNAKVYTPQQVKQARDFRDAMENVKDVGQDLEQTLGKEVLPQLTKLMQGFNAAIGTITAVDDKIKSLTGDTVSLSKVWQGINDFTSPIAAASDAIDAFDSVMHDDFIPNVNNASNSMGDMTNTTDEARDAMFGGRDAANELAASADHLKDNARKVADNLWDAGENARHAKVEMDKLLGSIAKDEAFQNMMLDVEGLNGKLDEFRKNVADGSMTQQEALRRTALAIDSTKQSLIDYYTKYEHIPPSVVTKVVADATAANLTMDQLAARLANLARLASTISFDNHTPDVPTPKSGGGKALQSFDGGRSAGGAGPNGDVYLQLDGATLMVFKNALNNLDRGTR